MLKVFTLVVTLHIGLLGRQLSNDMREWLSRLGGWLIAAALGWLLLLLSVVWRTGAGADGHGQSVTARRAGLGSIHHGRRSDRQEPLSRKE